MKNKLLFLVGGFIVGLIIGFFYMNANYQRAANGSKPEMPADHPNVEADKSAQTGSHTGPLAAFNGNAPTKADNGADAPKADSKFKNVQVLKDIPANQLITVMQGFSEGLGVKCDYCHVEGGMDKDDKPTKQTARKMLQMVRDVNKNYPTAGQVTCYTCHRGASKPVS